MSQYPQYTVPAGLINLGVGQPSDSMLPLDLIRQAVQHRFSFDDPLLLQYGDIPGYRNLRKILADYLSKAPGVGQDISPDNIFVTNGNTGAMILACTFFTKAGDIVYAEDPSYFLALNTFRDFNLTVDTIPTDNNGLDVDYLEQKLRNTTPEMRPKFIYTIPYYNNPMGATLPSERREKLVRLSEEYNFLIVADEVYQLLGYDETKPIPKFMYHYDRKGTVLSCGSFSKILAPALRLGYIVAGRNILSKIEGSGQLDSSGALNPIISAIVHSAIEQGLLDENIKRCRKVLGAGAKALCDALKVHIPSECTWVVPSGGYFVWLEMPETYDAEELWKIAKEEHKVQFHPGIKFSATKGKRNCLRLSVSYYDEANLGEGAKRLGAAIRDYQKVVAGRPQPSAQSGSKGKVRVAVHGATGRLGSLIVAALASSEGAVYAGPITRDGAVPSCDVVVDVSSADGLQQLLPRLTTQPLVVGTTGDLPKDALDQYSRKGAVALVPNFSIGVPLMMKLLEEAKSTVPKDWSIEMVEAHHTAKKDAPSGTAKRLAQPLGGESAVAIHSIRAGDTIGEHTVWFAGPGERIEIKHVATKREVFANGAVRTSVWLANNNKPGLIQL